MGKVGAGVAATVSDFTGKEKYAFGDVTKAAIGKLARHFKKHRPGGSEKGPPDGACDSEGTCTPAQPGANAGGDVRES